MHHTFSVTGNGTTDGQWVFEAMVHIVKYCFILQFLVNIFRKHLNFWGSLIFSTKIDNWQCTAKFSQGYVFS